MKDSFPYNDILHLPHHVSPKRKPMSMISRAGQFSPFAALTGYDDVIAETARLVDQKIELSEDAKIELDRKQQYLFSVLSTDPTVSITFFVADQKKQGGAYLTETSPIKKIDTYSREIILANGTVIPMDDILDLEGEIFSE